MKRTTRTKITRFLILTTAFAVFGGYSRLQAQQRQTTEAFNQYIATAEARISGERNSSFSRLDSVPLAERMDMVGRLRHGEIVIDRRGDTTKQVPGGLIHDWVGTVFVPNVSVSQIISLVRDYDHTASYYSPDVMESRLVSANGNDLHVFMRLRKQKIVTVVLDTEYDVHYGSLDADHQYSISRSARISEIEDPGSAHEHALAQGHDHGFLWRLNSYWSFEQANGGVFVQCEAISLTREIPTGLAWMIAPFVSSIPRESLEFTLNATRAAFKGKSVAARRGD